jgi:hypothetical protein
MERGISSSRKDLDQRPVRVVRNEGLGAAEPGGDHGGGAEEDAGGRIGLFPGEVGHGQALPREDEEDRVGLGHGAAREARPDRELEVAHRVSRHVAGDLRGPPVLLPVDGDAAGLEDVETRGVLALGEDAGARLDLDAFDPRRHVGKVVLEEAREKLGAAEECGAGGR